MGPSTIAVSRRRDAREPENAKHARGGASGRRQARGGRDRARVGGRQQEAGRGRLEVGVEVEVEVEERLLGRGPEVWPVGVRSGERGERRRRNRARCGAVDERVPVGLWRMRMVHS